MRRNINWEFGVNWDKVDQMYKNGFELSELAIQDMNESEQKCGEMKCCEMRKKMNSRVFLSIWLP